MNTQVLIVDDDPMLLASLKRCLQGQYVLRTTASAEEALCLLRAEQTVPVVISDMRMPAMDGVEFLRKASEITPRTQFLMLTGTPNDSQRIRRHHGDLVSRFLTKPCGPEQIAEAIDEALEAYAGNTSAAEEPAPSA